MPAQKAVPTRHENPHGGPASSGEEAAPVRVPPPFGLFCKTFSRDLRLFERLVDSVLTHAQEPLPFVVSVPAEERELFRTALGERRVELVTDEEILGESLPQSWHQQQVVKLQAWRLGFAESFLVLDADFRFLRPFARADFEGSWILSRHGSLYGTPAGAPVSCEECQKMTVPRSRWGTLSRWTRWLDRYVDFAYTTMLRRIRRVFGRPGPLFHCMPGPIWPRALCAAFHEEFLEPRGLSCLDIIRYAPWEAVWMTEFMLARGWPGLVAREPFFLHFSNDAEVRAARQEGWALTSHQKGVAVAAGHCTVDLLD